MTIQQNLYGFPQPIYPVSNLRQYFPPTSPYIVGPEGNYSTIQAAINAAYSAGGGTVLIQPGSYTENLTLRIGVGLAAVEANVDSLHVQITGVHTPDPSNGTMSFKDINFFGVDKIIYSTAAGEGYMTFEQCNWSLSATGYIFDILNWVGPTGLVTSNNGIGIIGSGDLSTADSGFLRNTGGMHCSFINSFIGSYTSGMGAVPMITSGHSEFAISDIYCPVEFRGGTGNFIEDCTLHSVGVTVSGTSTGYIVNCALDSLTTAAFTMSSSGAWYISETVIGTSNNPAIAGSGAGALTLAGVSFLSNSATAGTLTLGTTAVTISPQFKAIGDVTGTAGSNSLTGISSTTISTGVGSVKMSTASAANNAGWIKIYIGATAYWIPAWTTNAP